MTLVVTHSKVTGAAADSTALVDGPAWDANHALVGAAAPSQGGTGVANNDASTITITGSFGITFEVSAATSLTLPTSGSLAAGPGSATVGNIAYWNNTTGTALAASATFQASNPSNSALYSPLAIPGAGNGTYNGMQVGIGTAITSADVPNPTNRMIQGVVGTTVIPAAETSMSAYGVMGLGRSDSTSGSNAIGVGGWGFGNNAAANVWAMAGSVHNKPFATTGGLDANSIIAAELDVNIWKKAGAVEPTISQLHGLLIAGSGDSAANQGDAVLVNKLNVSTGAKWNNGFITNPGAAVNAFVAGPVVAGNSQASQPLIFQNTGAGGGTQTSQLNSDGNGSLIVKPSSGLTAFGSNSLTPDAPITINANTVAGLAPTANMAIHLVSADGANTGIQMDTFGTSSSPLVSGRFARGTAAAKAVPQSADFLLNIQGQGYDTSAYSTGARTQYRATETWSATAHGSEYAVAVTANTTTTLTDALIVKNSGATCLGTAADPGTSGSLAASGSIKSSSPTGGVGYSTGAGGAVTQLTSKTTGVTLNTACGAITMNAAALASGAQIAFTLTDSAIAATDVLIINHVSGGTIGAYLIFPQCAAGSATINVLNRSAGSLSEAIVLQFAVIKGVNA